MSVSAGVQCFNCTTLSNCFTPVKEKKDQSQQSSYFGAVTELTCPVC